MGVVCKVGRGSGRRFGSALGLSLAPLGQHPASLVLGAGLCLEAQFLEAPLTRGVSLEALPTQGMCLGPLSQAGLALGCSSPSATGGG